MKGTTFYCSCSFPLCPLQERTAHGRLGSGVALCAREEAGSSGRCSFLGGFLRHAGTLSRESSFWTWLSSLSSFNTLLFSFCTHWRNSHAPKLHMTFFPRQKQGRQTRSSKETDGASTDKNIREPGRGQG